MEEIREESPVNLEASAEEISTKTSFMTWLGTDEAVRWVYLIFGLLATLLILAWLQFATRAICCGDWDGYYHIRWSQLIWENLKHFKMPPEFTWLPLTVLNANSYADHHFFFHLLQIPFLWFFEPVMAAKLATVFYGTLAIFSCYWLIFRYKIDYLLIWFLGLMACANPFFYRMNMAKAPQIAIVIMIFGVFFLFERRYMWLAPLMFLFVWSYSFFPVLLIMAIIWSAIIAWNERKFEWQPLAFTFGGMIAGNIINPYFPKNIGLFIEHTTTKGLTKAIFTGFPVGVGGEWYPYNGVELIKFFPVALIAMLVGYILFSASEKKFDAKALFFLIFSTFLFFLQLTSKRYAEYFPPFAILFAAFSWHAYSIFQPKPLELPEDFKRDLAPFLDKIETSTVNEPSVISKYLHYGFVSLVGILLTAGMIVTITSARADIVGNEADDKYQRGMNYISENVPEGERIFNADWDDFPKMFYFDQKHSYVTGLDPQYLFSQNPELSKTYEDITNGKNSDPGPVIKEKFGSNYVFSDSGHQDLYAKAMESGWFDKVYDDDEVYILKIRDKKGEPPAESVDDGKDEPTDEEIKAAENEESNENAVTEGDDDNTTEDEPEK